MNDPEQSSRVRRVGLGPPLVLAWAFSSVLVAAWGAQGVTAVVIVSSFCLFGVGVAFEGVLEGQRRVADALLIILGVGLGSATVVSQTLLVLDLYHPVLVAGVLSVAAASLVLVGQARRR